MKTWNYHTYKGRRFFRLNHAKLSKSMFFLAYYRILHTAYLKRQRYCIAAVKRMFVETFGLEPDAWSVAYITDTEKCFVNDTITEALNKNGKIACSECLRQMLIEIGFDAYLIQTVGAEKKPDRKAFIKWLPMKKSRELKKTVKCFWKERLPKEKLLYNLYYQLEPLKKEILGTYRKILLANDTILTDTPEKETVISYISNVLDSHFTEADEEVCEDKLETINSEDSLVIDEADECIQDDKNVRENEDTEEIMKEVSEQEEAVIELISTDESETRQLRHDVPEEGENLQPETDYVGITVENFDNPVVEPSVKTDVREAGITELKTEYMPINTDKTVRKTVAVTQKKCAQECRGFLEKNKMTKKKAVTCAVCVAAAGALLVPLVAYTVIKHKAA